jgi:hypothetical protein
VRIRFAVACAAKTMTYHLQQRQRRPNKLVQLLPRPPPPPPPPRRPPPHQENLPLTIRLQILQMTRVQ